MATLTIRNIAPKIVRALKQQAERNRRSMEQEAREILAGQVADRSSAVDQIVRAWAAQKKAPSAHEVDAWIREGRP
jgi:plasmid stability protein